MKKNKIIYSALIPLLSTGCLMVPTLSSCVNDSKPVSKIAIIGIPLNVYVGDTFKIDASLDYSNGNTITWGQEGYGEVQFSKTKSRCGSPIEVTAVRQGDVTILATSGGKTVGQKITIKPKDTSYIDLDVKSTTIETNETFNIKATIIGQEKGEIRWSQAGDGEVRLSSDESISGESITITGKKSGKVKLTASWGSKSATCDVTIEPAPKNIKLDVTSKVIEKGKSFEITATLEYQNATIEWTQSGSGKVELSKTSSASGEAITVTGKESGVVELTASVKGLAPVSCAINIPTEETHILEISANEDFQLSTANGKGWDGHIWYSFDKENWTEWDGSSLNPIAKTKKLYLCGSNNYLSTKDLRTNFVFTGSDNLMVQFDGNIMSLINYDNPTEATISEYCFSSLFLNCSCLVSAPALPATKLAKCCYYEMFRGCKKLSVAPALPAMDLAESCYSDMFLQCESLEAAPELHATTLYKRCYYNMFLNCFNLTKATKLPATKLAQYCYYGMFRVCKKLKVSETTGTNEIFTCPSDAKAEDVAYMFEQTGGSYTGGTPDVNKTYYYN